MLVLTCLQLLGRLNATFLFPQKSKDFLPVMATRSNSDGLFPCFRNFLKVFYGSWEIFAYPLSVQQVLGCLHKICLQKCLLYGVLEGQSQHSINMFVVNYPNYLLFCVCMCFVLIFFILARYVQFSPFTEPEKLVTRPSSVLSQ